MLARWIDPATTETVAGLARAMPAPRRIDPTDDGTTAGDLAEAVRGLGLTPTRGAAAEYPYIALVTYNKLPRQNRYVEDINIPHWIVRLGDGWYHDPYWPGERGAGLTASKSVLDAAERGVAYRVSIVEVPEMAVDEGKAREPYGRVVHVIPPDATEAQAVAIFRMAWQNDRQTVSGSYDDAGIGSGLQFKRAVLHGIELPNRDSFRAFYQTWYPSTVVEFVDDVNIPPTPAPTIDLKATPLNITAGQTTQLDWRVTNATGVALNGEAVSAIGSRTVKPAKTTEYTIRAVGSSVVTKSVTVGVTPVQPPPPPPKINIQLGVNDLGGAEIADAMGRAGAGTCSISFNPGLAARIAQTYPNTTVLVRPAMIGWNKPGAAAWRSAIELDKFAGMPNAIMLGSNEGDNAYMLSRGMAARRPITIMSNSDRAMFDLDCCRLAHAAGVRYALGGWSYGGGCDITDRGSIYEFVVSYERVVKESIERTGLVYFNLHMYSGSDGSRIGLWDRFGPQTWDTTLPNRGDFNAWPSTWKPITIRCRQNLWTVERWRALVVFLVEYGGIDPRCIRFVSDEMGWEGTDSMPPALFAGSFFQNNCSPADFLRYCDELVRVQGLPTVWAYNGQWKQADSNFEVGEFFAANGGEKWAGYAMETYWPIMAQSGRTWWRALA